MNAPSATLSHARGSLARASGTLTRRSFAYASGARLRQAQMAANLHRYDEAIAHLQWVVDNSKDEGLSQLAALRMARLLYAQEKTDQALAMLDKDAGRFLPLYLELRGDILLAKGERESARTAYSEALAETDPTARRSGGFGMSRCKQQYTAMSGRRVKMPARRSAVSED